MKAYNAQTAPLWPQSKFAQKKTSAMNIQNGRQKYTNKDKEGESERERECCPVSETAKVRDISGALLGGATRSHSRSNRSRALVCSPPPTPQRLLLGYVRLLQQSRLPHVGVCARAVPGWLPPVRQRLKTCSPHWSPQCVPLRRSLAPRRVPLQWRSAQLRPPSFDCEFPNCCGTRRYTLRTALCTHCVCVVCVHCALLCSPHTAALLCFLLARAVSSHLFRFFAQSQRRRRRRRRQRCRQVVVRVRPIGGAAIVSSALRCCCVW